MWVTKKEIILQPQGIYHIMDHRENRSLSLQRLISKIKQLSRSNQNRRIRNLMQVKESDSALMKITKKLLLRIWNRLSNSKRLHQLH